MLDTLRASGRQVFLATNSLFDYTHIVMVRTGLKFYKSKKNPDQGATAV